MPGATRNYSELVARTRWYVYLRWVLLLLVIIPSLATSYFDVGWGTRFIRDLIFCAAALFSNSLFHVLAYRLKNRVPVKALAYVVVLADVLFITFFLQTKGGIESRSVILYLLPMIAGAAILGRIGTYITAVASIVGFTFIIIGGYFGWLGAPLSVYTPQLDHSPGYVANTIVFFDFVLLIVAIALDYMTSLLIRNEASAQEALFKMSQAQLIAKTGGWEFDTATQNITYSKELYTVMSAVVPQPVINMDEFAELIHPDDRTLVRRKLTAVLRRPVTYSYEHRMLARDGSVRYLHVDGRSIADRSGTVVQILGSARDITDEKALQKARNDFVALASHQLRTPATIVKQYVGMLKDGFVGSVPEAQQQMLDIVYETNERQIKIVNDLLNVARIDSNSYKINRERSDLRALLEHTVRDQDSKFKTKDQSLVFKSSSHDVFARIDCDGLRMVIDNLLDNAHKYTPPGKTVRVGLQTKGQKAIITVSDGGIGIAKSDLPKMFKLFSRVENPMILQQEGTGLGLYWADRIVRLHKGKIAVNSEIGKGTTFTITVPL